VTEAEMIIMRKINSEANNEKTGHDNAAGGMLLANLKQEK
jgi:hypothetical protein